MYNYLDQIGRQEFARQHFDQISKASDRTSTARIPGSTNRYSKIRSVITPKSKTRVAVIIATIVLAVLVIGEALASIATASSGAGVHLVR